MYAIIATGGKQYKVSEGDIINVEKLAHIVQSQSESTQFIVVSHRKPMIESANRTIGVTQKEKGISKVTGVKLRD